MESIENEKLAQGEKVKTLAERILAWAKQNRLFSKIPVDEGIDESIQPLEMTSQSLFESQAVVDILRKRSINLIGYNEPERKIVIFTNSKLTKGDEKLLPFAVSGEMGEHKNIRVEYVHGGIASVKDGNRSDSCVNYYLNNGFVTCGSSVFPVNCIGAGTFGALVRGKDGKLFGLTNNHVTGACNFAAPGLPILCPGPLDANEETISPFTIGRHTKLRPINDGIPENVDITLNLDAALFEIEAHEKISSHQGNAYDTPINVLEPQGGMRVKKVGRTTGLTEGVIICVAASPVPVCYSLKEYGINKTVFFHDVYIVQGANGQPFSKAGDSGSLVVCETGDGALISVGLVFAGCEQRSQSFILPLNKVLDAFDVELVNGHNVI